jgi:hypothetical protein
MLGLHFLCSVSFLDLKYIGWNSGDKSGEVLKRVDIQFIICHLKGS